MVKVQTEENIRKSLLTNAQLELLRASVSKSSLPLEEVATQSDDAKTLIRAGLLRLAIVVNPWGVDYDLSPTRLGIEVSEQLARSGGEAT
jgi:hypothetical protein